MTKEEKKAIKELEEFAYSEYGCFTVGSAKTILNLIEKFQKENKKSISKAKILKKIEIYEQLREEIPSHKETLDIKILTLKEFLSE